jgi:uncharacterized protein (DUF1697 family)
MHQLKATFERVGMDDVQTYINSGNVIFHTGAAEPTHVAHQLEAAIHADFGFPVMVMLRNMHAITAIVNAIPASWVDGKAAKCDVLFLHQDLDHEHVRNQLTIKPEIDHVTSVPGAMLWHVDRAQLTRSGLMKLPGSTLYQKMTIRNCNTVRKLAERMHAREALR